MGAVDSIPAAQKPRLTYSQFLTTRAAANDPSHSWPARPLIRDLIERYIAEIHPLKPIGRSQKYAMLGLQRAQLGSKVAAELKPSDIIDFCRARRQAGVSPATVTQDITYLRAPLAYAALAWDMPEVSLKPIVDARLQLERLNLVGKARVRDRRPTREEYDALIAFFREQDQRSDIPMAVMMEFAVWSARRISEITRLRWDDVDDAKRTCIVRDMKDPRQKKGNHHTFPLLGRAWDLVQAQPRVSEFIFPYNPKSAGARYTKAKKALGIQNLRFHDLRREAASRLFEAGYSVVEVQLVTGHKNPNMLLRVYTKLKPEDLHHGPALMRKQPVKSAANDGDDVPIAA